MRTYRPLTSLVSETSKLKDGNSHSQELRRRLRKATVKEIRRLVLMCLETGTSYNRSFVLQDVVNEIGIRLGFRVEPGMYRGRLGVIGYDGLWHFFGHRTLVVETKTRAAFRYDPVNAVVYWWRLANQQRLSLHDSSILFVIAHEDTERFEQQIRGSRYALHIQVVSVRALCDLVDHYVIRPTRKRQEAIQRLFIPTESNKLDNIVDFASEILS